MNRRWLKTAERKLRQWQGVPPVESVYRSRISRIQSEIGQAPPCSCSPPDDLLSSGESEENAA